MSAAFTTIGIIGKLTDPGSQTTLTKLATWLTQTRYTIIVDEITAAGWGTNPFPTVTRTMLGSQADVLIVIGGDGSLLQASHVSVPHNKPVIGIHRGKLGFLTDLDPQHFIGTLKDILEGHYQEDRRLAIKASILNSSQEAHPIYEHIALNDVVLMPGELPRMITFELFIDQQFVFRQRADGLIIATPTGSTAYALSGGGPIVHPSVEALVLVPMFPHTISSRPIVLSAQSTIEIRVDSSPDNIPRISCDGLPRQMLSQGLRLCVQKIPQNFRVLHPIGYDYFATLRNKLHWEYAHTS